MNDQSDSRERKAYEPPVVRIISLRPEEAVLGHCKNANHGGPAGNPCTSVGNCTTPGS